MADNVNITPGAGTAVATDDVGGVHYQRVKVGHGADGSYTDAAAASPLPVGVTGAIPAGTNTIGSVNITNPVASAAGLTAGVTAYGYLRSTTEPHALFGDPFDGVIDVNDRWTISSATLPEVAPTVSAGRMTIEPGTTVSQKSFAVTKPTFVNTGVNFVAAGWTAQFETVAGNTTGTLHYTNQHRFMGFATIPGTWQAAQGTPGTSGPLLHAMGFEVDVDGTMYCVVYDTGVRTKVPLLLGGTSLNATRNLVNGENHQFGILFRADVVIWYVDGLDIPAAVYRYSTAGFSMPDVQTLPLRFHAINATSAPPLTPVFKVAAIGAADTGSNANMVCDGVFPWRRAAVTDVTNIPGSGRYSAKETTYGNALNVNSNAIQKATYWVSRGPASGTAPVAPTAPAAVANTDKILLVGWHTASSTKTVRIRRVSISALLGTAVTYLYSLYRTAAVPTGGTVVASRAADVSDPASETSWQYQSTLAIGTQMVDGSLCDKAVISTTGGHNELVLYDWAESGETKPITMKAGVLDGIVITSRCTTATAPDAIITIIYTEE